LSKTISTDLLMHWLSLFKSILRVKILKSFIGLSWYYHILFFECGRDSKMFWIDIICYQSWKYYLKKYEWTTLKDIARLVVLWNTFSSKSDFYFSWDHSFYIFSDKCWYSKKLDILRRCKLKQDRIQIINMKSYLWIQQCWFVINKC